MVMGYLESVDVSLSIEWSSEIGWMWLLICWPNSLKEPLSLPVLPAYADAPDVDPTLVLRAILVKEVPDLDLNEWNEALKDLPP